MPATPAVPSRATWFYLLLFEHCREKMFSGFPTKFDTSYINFSMWVEEPEIMDYLCSEQKFADVSERDQRHGRPIIQTGPVSAVCPRHARSVPEFAGWIPGSGKHSFIEIGLPAYSLNVAD